MKYYYSQNLMINTRLCENKIRDEWIIVKNQGTNVTSMMNTTYNKKPKWLFSLVYYDCVYESALGKFKTTLLYIYNVFYYITLVRCSPDELNQYN